MKSLSLVIMLALGACAYVDERIPISYEVTDDADNEMIVLRYTNDFDHALCLSTDQWPNSKGVVDRSPDSVLLHVGGQVFRMDYAETGYCPGCAVEARPEQTIVGRLPYARFQLPAEFYSAPKQLEMDVLATKCQ